MSQQLVPRPSQVTRVPWRAARAVEAAHLRGMEAAARVQAAAFVTHVALTLAGTLTAEEGRLIQLYPPGEPRFRVLVDNFAGVAAAIITEMGY